MTSLLNRLELNLKYAGPFYHFEWHVSFHKTLRSKQFHLQHQKHHLPHFFQKNKILYPFDRRPIKLSDTTLQEKGYFSVKNGFFLYVYPFCTKT